MRMIKWIGMAALVLGTVACGKDSGIQRPADLTIYFTIPPSIQGESFDPDKTYVLPPPGVDNNSFMDVEVFNQGEGSMQILNVYLAENSNKYVSLEWANSDPSGEAKYNSGETVAACSPATATVSNPALLPTAQNVNPSSCAFPMTVDGQDPVTNLLDSRKFRLRYAFNKDTDEPDERPVNLIVHIDWKEGALGQEGVVNIPLQVQGCIPEISYYPPSINFSQTKIGSTDVVQVCLTNDGCQPLTVGSVYLETASVGDLFEVQESRVCSETQFECQTDNDCGLCSDGKYCSDDNQCLASGGVCEANGAGSCDLKYGQPLAGAVIEPKQENPESELCFKAVYKPFDSNPIEKDKNFLIIETDDPIQPKITIPMSEESNCDFAYEITHTDEVESGLSFMDFTGVLGGEIATKTITVTNTGGLQGCPIKLQSLEFGTGADSEKEGGPFYVEVRKGGENAGYFGKVGQPNFVPVVITGENSFDLVVTFTAPEGIPVNPTELVLNMESQTEIFSRTISIQAGDPQSKLVLGPQVGAGGNQVFFWFSSDSGDEESIKTLAMYNEGLAPVKLDQLTLDTGFGQSPDDYYLVDDGECVENGEFICDEIPPLGLITVYVAFTPVSGLFKSSAFLYIWTEDQPFTGESGAQSNYLVNLQGYAGLTIAEPYAEPVVVDGEMSEDEYGDLVYTGFTPGDSILLNGSTSEAYDGTLLVEQGYKWWLVWKPEGSAAKLNTIGGPETTLDVDKPGYYMVNLVVTAQDPSTSDFLLSEENWVDILVE